MDNNLERLRSIKTFPSLIKYLRDELEWPIESDDVEDLSFEYEPEELGLDPKTKVKIKEIKQLRPFVTGQPWGIFFISFEPKRLPIVALRRILRSLVIKKRQAPSKSQLASWQLNDLLFLSSYGESDGREISFAHFAEDSMMGDLPTLKVLGWNTENTVLRLEDTQQVLKEKLRWPEDETDADSWREQWSSAFKLQYRETVRTSKELATKLADLAILIRARVNDVLEVESEKGELRKLYKAFQEALIHDLSEDDFADMYAQTIAYGLLTASISRQSGGLVAENLKDMVPNTNPFLKELMQTFLTVGGRKNRIDFDELGINEVVELLRHTQMDEVLRDFGARNPQEDPVIHFYELFLKEYDPEKRMKRGVFYTPRPVVSFIVRSVDDILRTEFGLEDGLADITTWDEMASRSIPPTIAGESITPFKIPEGVNPKEPFVQILDPATGTGTFLVEVIDVIYRTMTQKWQKQGKSREDTYELWNDYVPRHLLPRIYGFELMMAPYAIAHMKIGLKLRETKYSFLSSERARVYLTNTLEEPKDFSSYFEQMAPALAHEAEAANKVKRSTPATIVIGNPPYSGHSVNNQITWIVDKVYDYKRGLPELLKPGQAKWLQDDYVKFLRYAQLLIARTGKGIVGYISNHSFLDNPTFRGLRKSFLADFTTLHLLDLHGNANKKEVAPDDSKDENVFDILQGVAVSILARSEHVSVLHADLYGTRDSKYKALSQRGKIEWGDLHPSPPLFLFVPEQTSAREEYIAGIRLDHAMNQNGDPAPGIVTTQDEFAISFTKHEAVKKVEEFLRTENEAEARKLFRLCSQSQWNYEKAKKELKTGNWKKSLVQVLYRPFDIRWTVYDSSVAVHRRHRVSRHMLGADNLGLITTRQTRDKWSILATTHPITHKALAAYDINFLFPLGLYRDIDAKLLNQEQCNVVRSNFAAEFIKEFEARLGLHFSETPQDSTNTFGPQDLFHYVYAIFHSDSYRDKYAQLLKTDFPYIQVTSDRDLFERLCALGADLVALHLLKDDYVKASWNVRQEEQRSPFNRLIGQFKGIESADVAKGHPKYKDGYVYVNPSCYFEGVPEHVWSFYVGGYRVCEKWLKDRRGRILSDEDVNHYQRIVVALDETISLIREIDRVIEKHGGWPLVGSQDRVTTTISPERGSEKRAEPLPFA